MSNPKHRSCVELGMDKRSKLGLASVLIVAFALLPALPFLRALPFGAIPQAAAQPVAKPVSQKVRAQRAKKRPSKKSRKKTSAAAARSVAAAATVIVDRVVAVVNDEVVLRSELLSRAAPLVADLDAVADKTERERRRKKIISQLLDDMINEELMVQAAVQSKLEVKQKEIQNALDEIKRQNKLDDKGLASALALQGYTVSSYKKDVKRQILRMRAINTLVRPRVVITDDDLRARFDEMNRRSAAVSKVHLNHVLISLPSSPTEAQLSTAKAKAADIITRVRAGEDFAAIAKKLSDDESTKAVGGDLGMIERGSIATEWEAVVFAMEKGEVRGPISGPRGLHVFYVSEVIKTDVKSFDELKEQIRNELYRRDMDKQTRNWMNELRKKAHIVKHS